MVRGDIASPCESQATVITTSLLRQSTFDIWAQYQVIHDTRSEPKSRVFIIVDLCTE
jgi:hypothetical protein